MEEKRRDARYGVDVDARVRNGMGAPRPVKVTNLSVSGCRFAALGNGIGVDAFVTITFGRLGFLDARVKWRAGEMHGIRFEQSLHPAVLDHIRYFLSQEAAFVEEVVPSPLTA
ncbi:MAG TPA: PilZ domain-containing protein [Croceibacterium sp.]|nr:PilZ domain-containing protein [Solirubrobacterales bacterium]HYD25954.1 PilZ domain-containing protein [Croceibacterium sp.]